ncbi:MAG: folate-binding protein [Acidobacteriaceae bacterium]|nr:folate-binding protein [Acidobacteriaceae bacterium]
MTQASHPAEQQTQLSALTQRAAVSRLDAIGWIRVSGEDRARWLNGMVTNAVEQLAAGSGAYNFFLNAQGQIQGDGFVFAQQDAFLIETQSSRVDALMAHLDRYIIMDDVELRNVSDTWRGVTVIGPEAAGLLEQAGLTHEGSLKLHEAVWNSAKVMVYQGYSPLVPRYEVWADAATIAALIEYFQKVGVMTAGDESLDWLRILEGTPRYGVDIRDRDLPQETGQTQRALHFTKGCYLGQEIVERIRSRGAVHRIFQAFRLVGELPAAGAKLEAAGKPAGELTSVARIPLNGAMHQLALGYVRREALDRGESLSYPGGTASPVASGIPPVRP